eukprot:Em0033g5a
MALFGAVGEYVEGEEDWSQYVERLGHFFGANGVSDASKKRSVLLSTIGPNAYQTLASLVAPETPGGKTYDELIKLMAEHLSPKPPVIVQRYRFHSRVRHQGESVSVYVTQLKELARKCEFGDALNDMLRDRLVCGINDERVQKRLLVEVNLTFDSALKISQGCEVAERCAKEIHSGRSQELAEHQNQQVHAVTPGRPQWRTGPGTGTPRCYRCLRRDHAPDKCPHRSAECFGCGKRGHIRRACKQVQAKAGGMQPSRRGVQVLQEESEDLEEEGDSTNALQQLRIQGVLCTINNEPIQLQVSIDGVLVTMELDTGAAVSIVSESTFRRLWSGKVLERSGIRLCTYSGESLKVIGKWEADVKYNNQTDKLSVIVLEGAGPSLLGRDWLHRFRIDWKSLFVIQKGASLENVLTKYEMVFNEGLGTVLGYEAKLVMKENAVPRFCKARPMPYAIKEKIEKELNKLVQEGILQPVELSEWAAPIVPVVKPDQSIRICGDFRLTVNQALETERYPLPKIEDILASLAGGERFTKLDLSKAYLQVQLDEASRKFMRIMDSVLQGIPKVIVYIDDILITGSTDKEHLETLEKVLYKLKEAGIHLNKDKCFFLQESVVYLGYKIDKNGIHPLAEKVEAVKNAPEPKNITELKLYLGLLTYYSRFLPRMATMLAQLYRLLQAKIPWNWTQKDKMAFENSKNLLLSAKVSGRIQRWIMTLAVYKYKLVFKKTEEHGNADALSRLPMDGKQIEEEEEIPTELVLLFESLKDSPVDCSQVKHWTKKDPILSQVLQYILAGWPLHPPSGPVEGQMLLVVTDAHSKWIEVEVGKDATAEATIQRLRTIFSRSAPYHPSSNGMAERAVQTVKQGVKKMTTGTLRDKLARFLFQYRITPQTTTGVSPAELLYGRRLRSRLDALHPNLAERVERRQQGQKAAHDTNAVERSFQEQESVYVKYYARGGRWKWVPGKITKCKGPLSFDVVLENGIVCRRHQDQLRKRAGEADDTWMGDRLSTDVAAEDPELNNGAQDEQEEDANYSVVGDEPEVDEEIDQEARPPVIVQQAPDRRYPSRNRRQPERYQAGFS